MKGAYYNEFDPYAAQWLRNLIAGGHIAPGDVDERSISEVAADDVRSYAQCHFFAGIGGWSHALRLAGWPDDRPAWTGSCPCQPFSAAGKRKGNTDERHLWPVWFKLIAQCRPSVVFGEQVESAIAHGWLDALCDDLEGEGYAVGAACAPAASVGAPHIRQRLWFVADTRGERRDGIDPLLRTQERGRDASAVSEIAGSGEPCLLADSFGSRLEIEREQPARDQRETAERGSATGQLADTKLSQSARFGPYSGQGLRVEEPKRPAGNCGTDHWSRYELLPCRDGKARPVEPGTFPLAHGVPARVGRLRAYGNAIVPQVAAQFIRAYQESRP